MILSRLALPALYYNRGNGVVDSRDPITFGAVETLQVSFNRSWRKV